MTDYIGASGDGDLMIRDLGSTVEYWVRAGYSNFWWDGLSFTITANGSSTDYSINYPSGANWYRITTRSITSSQTTTLRLNTATGTTSLAGPTSFSKFLDRGTVPDAPTSLAISNVAANSFLVTFKDPADNGGLAIDTRQVLYNTSNTTVGATAVTSDGSTGISGLVSGKTYWVWARVHNSKGWSSYTAGKSATTWRVPDAPSSVTYSNIKQNTLTTTFKANGNGGTAIIDYQIAYNTSNTVTGATIIVPSNSGVTNWTNLPPGQKLYFWARSRNAVGYSAWSAVTSVQLIAGAYVIYGGVPKRAVPYVKVNGAWKVAKPWVRSGSTWKEMAT